MKMCFYIILQDETTQGTCRFIYNRKQLHSTFSQLIGVRQNSTTMQQEQSLQRETLIFIVLSLLPATPSELFLRANFSKLLRQEEEWKKNTLDFSFVLEQTPVWFFRQGHKSLSITSKIC